MNTNRIVKAGSALLDRLRDDVDGLQAEAEKTGTADDVAAAEDAADELEALENLISAARVALPIVRVATLTAKALEEALAQFE